MVRFQFKYIISIISVLIALFVMSLYIDIIETSSSNKIWLLAGIGASAYAAIISIYLSRTRERRFKQRRIFIIYDNKDLDKASKIVEQLRDLGYNPWFDIDEITPGQKWHQAIMKGIEESSIALLLVSENLKTENGFISKEIDLAMSTMRSHDETFSPVIPIRLDDSPVPKPLSDVHWVDLRSKSGFEHLEKGLKRIFGQA